MSKIHVKKETIKVLRKQADKFFSLETFGICAYLHGRHSLPLGGLTEHFETWPKYSGDYRYPIQLGTEDPEVTYIMAKYKWIGKYGKLRKELALHIANELEKEVQRDEVHT